jgi:hypothetical protein
LRHPADDQETALMRRIVAISCLIATASLLPVQAEAAKIRSTGGKASRSVIATPGIVGAKRAQPAAAEQPQRVPFPPATAQRQEPPPLRLTARDEPRKPWCGSEVVVGGFCMMN